MVVGGGSVAGTGAELAGAADLVAEGAEDFLDAAAAHGAEGPGSGEHALGGAVAVVAALAQDVVDGGMAGGAQRPEDAAQDHAFGVGEDAVEAGFFAQAGQDRAAGVEGGDRVGGGGGGNWMLET